MCKIEELSDRIGIVKFLLDKLDSNDDVVMWTGIIKYVELYKLNKSFFEQNTKTL